MKKQGYRYFENKLSKSMLEKAGLVTSTSFTMRACSRRNSEEVIAMGL